MKQQKLCALFLSLILNGCSLVMQRAPMMPSEVETLLIQPNELAGKTLKYNWLKKDGCDLGSVNAEGDEGNTNVAHFIWLCPTEENAKRVFLDRKEELSEGDVFTDKSLGNKPPLASDLNAWCILYKWHFGNQNLVCVTVARYGRVVSWMTVAGENGKPFRPSIDDLLVFTKIRDTGLFKLSKK